MFLQNHQTPSTPIPTHAKYVGVTTLCCLKASFLMYAAEAACLLQPRVCWLSRCPSAQRSRVQMELGMFCSPESSPQLRQGVSLQVEFIYLALHPVWPLGSASN